MDVNYGRLYYACLWVWAKWVTLGEPMSIDSEPSLRPWRAAHSGPSGWHSVNLWVLTLSHPSDHEGQHTVGQVGDTRWTYECWLWAIPPTMKGSTQWAKWVTLGEPMSVDSEPSLRPWRAAHSGPSGWHSVNLWVLTLSHPSDHEGQHTVGQVGDTRWAYECWLWAIPPTMKGSTQWAKWVTLGEPMSVDSEPSLRPWRAAHSGPSGWHSVSLWVLTLSHPSDHEGQHTVGQVGDTQWTYECWLWAIPPTMKGSTQWAKWVTPRPLTSLFIGS